MLSISCLPKHYFWLIFTETLKLNGRKQMLTLTESSKETGLTRSAIFKAIKSGRLSANKNNKGEFLIDPAELFRVYKPVNKEMLPSEQLATHKETQETAELSMMKRLLAQVESERDDLRRRLDEESAERRKLMNILTHQPETFTEQKMESKLFMKLFGRRYNN
jgi:hypothetical protein